MTENKTNEHDNFFFYGWLDEIYPEIAELDLGNVKVTYNRLDVLNKFPVAVVRTKDELDILNKLNDLISAGLNKDGKEFIPKGWTTNYLECKSILDWNRTELFQENAIDKVANSKIVNSSRINNFFRLCLLDQYLGLTSSSNNEKTFCRKILNTISITELFLTKFSNKIILPMAYVHLLSDVFVLFDKMKDYSKYYKILPEDIERIDNIQNNLIPKVIDTQELENDKVTKFIKNSPAYMGESPESFMFQFFQFMTDDVNYVENENGRYSWIILGGTYDRKHMFFIKK